MTDTQTRPAMEVGDDGAGHGGRCGGTRRDGKPCRNGKGFKTPHPGIGRCHLHGGSTESHVVAAGREVARMAVAKLGGSREVDPHTFLIEEVHRTAAAVEALGILVDQVGASVTDSDRGLLAEWRAERRHGLVAAKTAIDAGVDVRRVELEQARVSMQAAGVRVGMDAVGMGEEERVVFVRAMIGQLRVAGETEGE